MSLPRFFRFYGAIIVLLAIFAQGIIPTGFMPTVGHGKFFAITICQGAGQATILVDGDMQPLKGQGHQSNEYQTSAPCLFAGMTSHYLVQKDFIFQQIEHLTYERFVVRDVGLVATNILAKFYDGQAPPKNQYTL